MEDKIILEGLRENNLKNIDLYLPKGSLIVFAGLSGSGKSSVVFETLARESQRQMTRNYSQYLRRHMPLYQRPEADKLENLSPVLVVEQKSIGSNIQSTVGSYLDLGPLIRLLFSRIGNPSISEASDYSINSSFGKCPRCSGNGQVIEPDLNKLIDFNKSLKDYAVQFKPLSPADWQGRWMITGGVFDPDLPIKDYPKDKLELFLYGPKDQEYIIMPFHTKNGPQKGKWDGLIPRFMRLYVNRDISNLKEVDQEDVLNVSSHKECPDCHGSGLNPKVLASKINGLNIAQYMNLEIPDLIKELKDIQDPLGKSISEQILPILYRLLDLGLAYLSLGRKVDSLSAGESQRIKIARQLGSSLNNLTYIFDEPSAGLHPAEISRLLDMLKDLRDNHNTVIVVEHNPIIIQEADILIELGPGPGQDGGQIIYEGRPENIDSSSPTGLILQEKIQINTKVRKASDYYQIRGARSNNLKNLDLDLPKNTFINICGLSGSGKSSLIIDEFYPKYKDQTVLVDQKAIGISSRSTLATYMGIMDPIRNIMAKETGQDPGLFSFNSKGACPVCNGKGEIQPDLAFADLISLKCESCQGTRYSKEALSYTYKGKNILDLLEMTADQGLELFENESIRHKLHSLKDVGLSYLKLVQATSTLSGGELQRLKLASQLQHQGKIYILDEPSTGLHPLDVDQLLSLFNKLVDQGNTLIVIEHNLKFTAMADWIVELGPHGGQAGGHLVFEGEPKDLVQADTITGDWLRKFI